MLTQTDCMMGSLPYRYSRKYQRNCDIWVGTWVWMTLWEKHLKCCMTSAKFSIKHCTKIIKLNSSELWKKFSSSDMWFLCYSYVPRHSLILECLISRRVVSVTSRTREVSRLVARCPPCLSDPPYQTLTCCWPSGGLWVFLIIVFTIIVIIAKRRFVGFTIIYCNFG